MPRGVAGLVQPGGLGGVRTVKPIQLGWGKLACVGGGGSFEPLSWTLLWTPDGLTVTPNRLTGEVGGGCPEVPQHI